jgi:hypothetical protein
MPEWLLYRNIPVEYRECVSRMKRGIINSPFSTLQNVSTIGRDMDQLLHFNENRIEIKFNGKEMGKKKLNGTLHSGSFT